jgi:hypothetical protein
MKKIAILLGCVLMLCYTILSFGKKEEVSISLVGKWKYFQEGKKSNKKESLIVYQHDDRCGKDYVEFFNDGKVNDVYYYGNENCDISVDTGTWEREGMNLIVSFPFAGKEKGEILVLDATTLKLMTTVEGVETVYVYKKM